LIAGNTLCTVRHEEINTDEYLSSHTVVTTVRSEDKADRIRALYPKLPKQRLDFAIVPDIAQHSAFDSAVQGDQPFDAVIHTASPNVRSCNDVQKELLDPAIIGTTGILSSIARLAPSVRRVVHVSSIAALIDASKGNWPGHTYTASDWNPITLEEALDNTSWIPGYRGSKTFAERAAWDFMEREKPGFTLTTLTPPGIFGPTIKYPGYPIEAPNASNGLFGHMLEGKALPTALYTWIDVKDAALAHVRAIEDEAFSGERVLLTSSEQLCNKDVLEIIYENFPELREKLPARDTWQIAGYPEDGVYKVDASRAKALIGRNFAPLKGTVIETVKMYKEYFNI
jgi:nucleoside-diphosphate-sugar epimerase